MFDWYVFAKMQNKNLEMHDECSLFIELECLAIGWSERNCLNGATHVFILFSKSFCCCCWQQIAKWFCIGFSMSWNQAIHSPEAFAQCLNKLIIITKYLSSWATWDHLKLWQNWKRKTKLLCFCDEFHYSNQTAPCTLCDLLPLNLTGRWTTSH